MRVYIAQAYRSECWDYTVVEIEAKSEADALKKYAADRYCEMGHIDMLSNQKYGVWVWTEDRTKKRRMYAYAHEAVDFSVTEAKVEGDE